jgi:predicted flavoprotein YhiN
MTSTTSSCPPSIAIIGGGPAGLMAAEVLSQAGVQVDLYDGMPSVGRKFLLAGVGGMNITHSEAFPAFLSRYGERAPHIAPLLRAFGADELCQWIHGLGIDTFVGSSGRVFPTDMKAAPLLRAWLKRLRDAGVVTAACASPARTAKRRCTPTRRYWPWVAAVGRAWVPTVHGCWRWNSAA